jgi:hypothetical protein
MTTEHTATPVRAHPIHRFTGRALAVLDDVAASAAWAMTAEEQAETLLELSRLQARVTELKWRVLVAAERNEVGAQDGSTSTAAWLANQTRENRTRANGDLRGAKVLDEPGFTATREAFAAGALTEDQVWVIIRAIEDLPADEVTDADRVTAQQHLIALAAEHDAKHLRILARRLFEVLAPGEADRREAAALEREERRARQQTRFSMRDNGDGTHTGWFKLPTAQAQMLTKALQGLTAPRRTDPNAWVDADGKKVPYPTLLGHAFCDLIEHLPVDKLPQAGGLSAAIIATMDLDNLRRGVGSATLDTGEHLSPGQIRRMSCNAGLIPAVLGGDSQPLDLGRLARLFDHYQRLAMAIRDGGCTSEGCDRPPAWCEAHHDHHWADGGTTDLDKGRLLCPFHHHLAHDNRYHMQRLTNGKVRFTRRR